MGMRLTLAHPRCFYVFVFVIICREVAQWRN